MKTLRHISQWIKKTTNLSYDGEGVKQGYSLSLNLMNTVLEEIFH